MKPKLFDWGLLLPVLILFAIGLIMVYSSSPVHDGQAFDVFQKQLLAGCIGLVLMGIASKISYNFYRQKMVWYLMFFTALILLVGVLFQRPLNGAHRWFVAAHFTFQPLYFAMFVVITYVSSQVSQEMHQPGSWKRVFINLSIHAGAIFVLLASQPDFGNLMILAGITGMLLFLANIPLRLVALGSVVVAIFAGTFISVSDYRRERMMGFLHEESYQTSEASKAIASGGLLGAGIGMGKRRLGYLPEANSDFIFSALGEDLGFFGTGTVLFLYLFFFGRGIIVLSRVPCQFARIFGMGLLFLIVVPSIVNISVNLALLPNKGLPLPFISAGGSALIFSLTFCGVLLNISRYRELDNRIEAK